MSGSAAPQANGHEVDELPFGFTWFPSLLPTSLLIQWILTLMVRQWLRQTREDS